MDKEEYREEVIRQLKKQNEALTDIVGMLFLGLIIVFIILILEMFSFHQLVGIKCNTDSIKDFAIDFGSDVDCWLQSIDDYVTKIYGYVKWK